MTLLSDIWRSLLWCGMIGAALGLFFSVVGVLRGSLTPGSSAGWDIGSGTFVGMVMGVVLLGAPACVWSLGRWLLVKPTVSTVEPAGVAHDAGRAAMAGSAAAIPGGFVGGAIGIFLLLALYASVGFISLMTGSAWWTDLFKMGVVPWMLGFVAVTAVLGALTGMVLGGTIGAIFGGLRSVTKH